MAREKYFDIYVFLKEEDDNVKKISNFCIKNGEIDWMWIIAMVKKENPSAIAVCLINREDQTKHYPEFNFPKNILNEVLESENSYC